MSLILVILMLLVSSNNSATLTSDRGGVASSVTTESSSGFPVRGSVFSKRVSKRKVLAVSAEGDHEKENEDEGTVKSKQDDASTAKIDTNAEKADEAKHHEVLSDIDKELSDEDKELQELLDKAKRLVERTKDQQNNKDKFHKLTQDDVKFAKDLGLTDDDIDDLQGIKHRVKMWDENGDDDGAGGMGRSRSYGQRPDSDSPPDGMVAPAEQKRRGMTEAEAQALVEEERKQSMAKYKRDLAAYEAVLHGDGVIRNHGEGVGEDGASTGGSKHQLPIRPHEPSDPTIRTERMKLQEKVTELENKLAAEKEDTARLRGILSKARAAFQHSVEEARQERTDEMAEMRSTIEEQKRAFDELFEEKKIMTRVLDDEQKALKDLQSRIQHPDLGMWLRDRAHRAALLMETPETDAMKFYAKRYMAPRVDKLTHRLQVLERRVEQTVDHLLPTKYGTFVAIIICCVLIAFPVYVTMMTVLTLSARMSLKQYVLLGNIFLAALAIALCVMGLVLRQDPLQTLYEANGSLFTLMQIIAAILFPCFLLVVFATTLNADDRLDKFVFGCEFMFYLVVGLNYRAKVWRPTMLGLNIETNSMMYFVYLMDFISMTLLTVSIARVPTNDHTGITFDLEAPRSIRKSVQGGPERSSTNIGGRRTGENKLVADSSSVGSSLLKKALMVVKDTDGEKDE